MIEQKQELYINTRKMYKVWFSKDADVFLNPENQLRFIKFRNHNPQAAIFLVYSATLLSSRAIGNMNVFLGKLHVTPVDIDELKIETEGDRSLHALIKLELKNCIEGKGGNLGAAADMTRLLHCTAANYGIYTDFDVELNTSTLPQMLQVTAPFIHSDLNNDLMAFACNMNGELTKEAGKLIQTLQGHVINNYKKGLQEILDSIMHPLIVLSKEVLDDAIHEHKFENSVFGFRLMAQSLEILDFLKSTMKVLKEQDLLDLLTLNIEEIDAAIKRNDEDELFTLKGYIAVKFLSIFDPYDVINQIKSAGLKEYAKADFLNVKSVAYISSVSSMAGPEMLLVNCNAACYHLSTIPLMKSAFYSSNNIDNLIQRLKGKDSVDILMSNENNIGIFGDQSFTDRGARNAKERDDKVEQSVVVIQSCVRGHLARKHRPITGSVSI